MAYRFRHAICNEVFEGWDFADSCRAIKKAGYDAIEIAPFTLNEYPATITADERRNLRSIIDGEGLEFVGLHWLMVAPKGLHVTTPDTALREKSWQHIHDLIDLCGDISRDEPAILVFGSPKQRSTTGGSTPAEATRRWTEGFAQVAPHAGRRNITVLVESLPSADSDVCNTVAEAVEIVKQVNHPAVRTMFDTHNAADETEPHEIVVDRFFDLIRHVHVNERDGRHPGTGDYPFEPVLATLAKRNYHGYVSLEVFDFKAGAEKIANDSLRYMERQIASLGL
ncbi:MAG: sugar phosphate isomerase/epimerase [Bryobacterales bacterium]|nr:sugar phosphate isomerase/epimerase [Bryobacterales bacterium]